MEEKIPITVDILIDYIEELATDMEILIDEDPLAEDIYRMNLACIEEIRKAVWYREPMPCKTKNICPECGAVFSADLEKMPAHYCPKCGQHVAKTSKP